MREGHAHPCSDLASRRRRIAAQPANWRHYEVHSRKPTSSKYASQECSRYGDIVIRDPKKFVCHSCGHVGHADADASFNIALHQPISSNIGQLKTDRAVFKGSTDTSRGDSLRRIETPNHLQLQRNPTEFIRGRMSVKNLPMRIFALSGRFSQSR